MEVMGVRWRVRTIIIIIGVLNAFLQPRANADYRHSGLPPTAAAPSGSNAYYYYCLFFIIMNRHTCLQITGKRRVAGTAC